jgi:REP element-mobilizing transposase RayT
MTIELPFTNRKLHRLPAKAYATTGCEYFFTICARRQGKPFNITNLADVVIQSLLWTRQKYGWLLFCYCLMPDHLHFVCRLTHDDFRLLNAGARGWQPEGVLDHLARFKSYTTNQSWRLGCCGKLWQKSSYDRVLDLQRPFEEVVQYTLENPQRSGLVDDWQHWPYAQIVDPWWE